MKDITKRLASLRLTLVLLLLLALISAVGTFLPQGREPAGYVEMLGEAGARIVRALALGDMYHSPWYHFLLILLFLNMAACMITLK
jgi:cytochrome c biogenesis protein